MELTREQWQFLWDKGNEVSELNRLAVRDFVFELITEAGFDVVGDAVVKLA